MPICPMALTTFPNTMTDVSDGTFFEVAADDDEEEEVGAASREETVF